MRGRGNAPAALAFFASLFLCGAAEADSVSAIVDVKRGMEATFPVAIVDGRVALGPSRASKLGTAQPKDGEITVGVEPGGMTPYAHLRVVEKTSAPIDFVATGFIDRIMIDEIVLCGRLDMPVSEKIAAGSLHVSLGRFAKGTGVDTCK
jgi:hypothetical protein